MSKATSILARNHNVFKVLKVTTLLNLTETKTIPDLGLTIHTLKRLILDVVGPFDNTPSNN